MLKKSRDTGTRILIGTKAIVEDFSYLDPALHRFQLSVIGVDDAFVRKYESNTPLFKERAMFVERLIKQGFDVTLRLQPVIDVEQSTKVLKELLGLYSAIKVEHLKLYPSNYDEFDDLSNYEQYRYSARWSAYYLNPAIKSENISKIKAIAGDKLVEIKDKDIRYDN